jgi:hypothetical protein
VVDGQSLKYIPSTWRTILVPKAISNIKGLASTANAKLLSYNVNSHARLPVAEVLAPALLLHVVPATPNLPITEAMFNQVHSTLCRNHLTPLEGDQGSL